jgi:hypothetical protein
LLWRRGQAELAAVVIERAAAGVKSGDRSDDILRALWILGLLVNSIRSVQSYLYSPVTAAVQDSSGVAETLDWGALWSTLFATFVGAVVALIGAWWLDRRKTTLETAREKERAQQVAAAAYEERLESLIFRIVELLGARRTLIAAVPKQLPPSTDLMAAADTVRIVARGDDAKAAKALRYALDRVDQLGISDQDKELRVIGQIIRAWREDSHSAAKATERFDGVRP